MRKWIRLGVAAGLMGCASLGTLPARADDTVPDAPPDTATRSQMPAPGSPDQVKLITGLCGIQMKDMSEGACHCLAEKTVEGLSDPQRDYLIATVVSPPVAERMLKDKRVGQADQVEIFGFLNTQSDACRAGESQPGGTAPASAGKG
ncbi:hypothetical protein NPA31_012505 [Aurantimonas sp. MSK8Z-1]|uniref:hypothetical protein n=1 Tax=Mangrovibrevibacter kandeliae TaxID=2968473 RepID=UPI002118998F|nr:hypothetical protein [Aurantimonas sp. MSK8Z-1]MCW4115782.1 hypothetical protein [Aurantimonas sp. MSK8Z-1]